MIKPAEDPGLTLRWRPKPQPRPPLAERPTGILPDVTAAVGRTPLVALDRLAAGLASRIVGEARAHQPRWIGQGSDRAPHDRGGRASGPPQAGRRHRRADERQHRRWTGTGRGRQGISVHLRDGRQAVRGEARAAARVRRGGRHLPHRRQPRRRAVVLPRLRPAGAGDARRVEAGPVPQRQPIPRRTPPPPGRRSGRPPRAGSRTSWSRSEPAGR